MVQTTALEAWRPLEVSAGLVPSEAREGGTCCRPGLWMAVVSLCVLRWPLFTGTPVTLEWGSLWSPCLN